MIHTNSRYLLNFYSYVIDALLTVSLRAKMLYLRDVCKRSHASAHARARTHACTIHVDDVSCTDAQRTHKNNVYLVGLVGLATRIHLNEYKYLP